MALLTPIDFGLSTLTSALNPSLNGTVSVGGSSSGTTASIAPELSAILSQLSGAVADANALKGERQSEIDSNQALRDQYSKEAAFADASGLMTQNLNQAMQQALQSLTVASEGAGASQSSMRALLAQQAAESAAINAAALGAQQAVDYGGISANLSNTLELLTRTDDATLNALLQAVELKQNALNTYVPTSTSSSSSANKTVSTNNEASVKTAAPAPIPVVSGNVPYEPYPLSYGTTGSSNSSKGFSIGASATPQEVLNQQLTAILGASPLNQETVRNSIPAGSPITGLAF